VNTVGIAGQVLYFKGALDKLKVRAQFIAAGKYKSAAESFTREGPTQEARESLISTLSSMRQTWLTEVQAARQAHQQLGESLEHGPWTAQEARAHGLVDAIGFETEAKRDALERGSARETEVKFGPRADQEPGSGLAELIRVLAGTGESSGGPPHIVVLPAQGAIKVKSEGLFGEGGIAAKALTKTLRRLAKDKSVKAVVLRIDSPGGSALASDLMWHEVMQLRKKKPVIASVGDMAASGGYYLASAANKIIAERTSIVGSIGVFGGKVAVDEALAHFGVNSVTFPASPEPGAAERAAYLSPLAPWDEATQGRVRKQIESIYDLFIQRVAKGRKMKPESVRKVAEGRIWSGVQGKERGLVDEFGGLDRALELARQMGKLDEDAPVRVEGAVESLLELLMLGDDASAAEVTAAVQRLESRRGQLWSSIPAPVRPFISGLEPLLLGEHTLATMPFAVLVK
jgi:protease-4